SRIGDSRAVDPVESAFKEAGDDTFEFAVALYRLGNRDHVDVIDQGLKSQYLDQRVEALAVLSESADPHALDALVEAASRGSGRPTIASSAPAPLQPELRVQLAKVLGMYSEPKARDALISLLSDSEPEVRAASVDALAVMNTRGTAGPAKGGASNGGSDADSDQTVDAIVRVIKTEKSPLVLTAIAKSIDTLGRDRLVDALIPLAESSP